LLLACLLHCCAGVWVQLQTALVEKFSQEAAVDMTSSTASFFRGLYRFVCGCFEALGFPSRWGYFHVGQVLQLDPAWARSGVLDLEHLAPAQKHNLEVRAWCNVIAADVRVSADRQWL
jgi:hypothetical protein